MIARVGWGRGEGGGGGGEDSPTQAVWFSSRFGLKTEREPRERRNVFFFSTSLNSREREVFIRAEFSGEFYQSLTSGLMRSLNTLQLQIQLSEARSENGYGLWRPGLKTGAENGIFWSEEIGSGFGEPGGTPLPRIPRSTPPPPLPPGYNSHSSFRRFSRILSRSEFLHLS